jgi:hypothetical protein
VLAYSTRSRAKCASVLMSVCTFTCLHIARFMYAIANDHTGILYAIAMHARTHLCESLAARAGHDHETIANVRKWIIFL